LPGVGVVQITLDHHLSSAVPHKHATVLHLEGQSEWSVRGAHWSARPGSLGVKIPGEVYREHARRGLSRFQVVVFEDALVEKARAALDQPPADPRAASFDGLRDPRVKPLMTLHQAMLDEVESSEALEQTLSDALVTFVELTAAGPRRVESPAMWSAAVTRARALLDGRITEPVTLDELAAHARLDKFRLCRAFREQVGLPPHAYVTHRRVSLAQEMLANGVPQAEVAIQVGLYDQSQLHRHFKRILGVTPGAWARAMR